MPTHAAVYHHRRSPSISDAEYHKRVKRQLARIPQQNRGEPEQLSLPALAAMPVIVRDHGIAEAHTHPLVGRRRLDESICSWRTLPKYAWHEPLLEWARTGSAHVALAYDIDSPTALETLAAASMGGSQIPTPNITISRRASGHSHAIYALRRPVHRGANARLAPLETLARCSEWLRSALDADRGFTGVLVSNPTHNDYDTVWLRRDPYTLGELREHIPRGWRRPAKACTDVGRNCDIFRSLLRYAGVNAHSDEDVEAYARRLHQDIDTYNPHTFSTAELAGILKSVMHYRDRWRADGWHQPSWIALQAERGRQNSSHQQSQKGVRSGEARRARTAERDAIIVAHLANGLSTRAIAELVGVDHTTVVRVRQRSQKPIVRRSTKWCTNNQHR